MSEYISKNEAGQELREARCCDMTDKWGQGYNAGITEAIDIIDNISLADVTPIVHGHWKNIKRVLNTEWGECSNCDRAHEITRYCPYCGAKMDESED